LAGKRFFTGALTRVFFSIHAKDMRLAASLVCGGGSAFIQFATGEC